MDGPLSRHLVRFSEPSPVIAPQPGPGEARISLGPDELESRIAAARAEAGAQAGADVAAGFEVRLQRLQDERATDTTRHEAALRAAVTTAVAAARAEWVAAAAETLDAQLAAVAAALRDTLSAGLADVLRPLLSQTVTARILAGLVAALDQLLADPAHPAITVRGPADLLGAVRSVRGEAAGVAFEVGEGAEITMSADGAHVETRLAAAMAVLEMNTLDKVALDRAAPNTATRNAEASASNVG